MGTSLSPFFIMSMPMPMATDMSGFCVGDGRVMFPGYQTAYDPSPMAKMPMGGMVNTCVLYLFPGWTVDSKGGYAAAIIGTFAIPILLSLIDAGRSLLSLYVEGRVPKSTSNNMSPNKATPEQEEEEEEESKEGAYMSSTPHQWHWATLLGFDITTSCLFGLQMFLAYVLMLLVMLYEAWILFAIVAGFIPGVMLSSMIKRKYSSSLCSCPTGDQESLLTSDELSSYSYGTATTSYS